MATERREPPPHRVEVTVEWHPTERRIAAPSGRRARRALAVGAVALLAAAGGVVIAESPSTSPRNTPAVLLPHGAVKLRCEHTMTPRVFVGVPSRYAVLAAHAPKCP